MGTPAAKDATKDAPPMQQLAHDTFDHWLMDETPDSGVVVSSRARVARNLPGHPFAVRANPDQLRFVTERVSDALGKAPTLGRFAPYEMDQLAPEDRCFLRESYLISNELEKGGVHRRVYVAPERAASLMVNEEDHLRLSTLAPGFRILEAYERLEKLEDELEERLELAFSEELGYLTACPTNTGTGLRLSVMMHLPALTMLEQVEITLADLGSYGLVVRGAYGEHTENAGDLYQISNEITLGKTEEEIMDILRRVVHQIIEREMIARERLLREWRERLEDVVCRALGVLRSARRIDSIEAVGLLSRVRLGIGQEWGAKISHPRLSRLFVGIQPAHLRDGRDLPGSPHERDQLRAAYLRSIFDPQGGSEENN